MSTRRGSPTQVAESIPFDNSGNSFASEDVQAAIEEAASMNATTLAIFPIWAEENGALADGADEWSFGNGAVGPGNGIPVPVDCELFAISYQTMTAGTNTVVAVQQNQTNVAQMSPTSAMSSFDILGSPISFSAGDVAGFQTVTAGGANDVRITGWFRIITTTQLGFINDLLDVDTSTTPPNIGEALIWDGTNWVPGTVNTVDTFATIQVDGTTVSTDAPTLDFDSSDFTLTESPTDDFDITINDSGIDHDQTTNFVANEHIDHSTVDIVAGLGLSGGGDITTDRTIDFDPSELVTVLPESTDEIVISDISDSGQPKVSTVEEIHNIGPIYKTINQVNTFTLPSRGFAPMRYNNSGQLELASTPDDEADVIAIGFTGTTITIQEGGILNSPAHGETVGEWLVLDSTAGEVVSFDTLTGTNVSVQYLAIPIDADNILLRVDPLFVRDFFIPQDISINRDWLEGTGTVTAPAGTNRLLIMSIIWEDVTGGTNSVSDVQIGGVSGDSKIIEQGILSGIQGGASVFIWKDADIENFVGTAVTVTWTLAAPTFQVAHVVLDGVDQVNPVVQTNSDSGVGGTDTLDADVNAVDGGYVFLTSMGGNAGMGFTNNGTGFTRKIDYTIASADGVTDDKLITADATPENVNVSITGSNRHVLVSGSLRRQE